MTERSRRAFLARGVAGVGTAVGGVTLAGCSSVFDEEPEPIGVEEEQLREVAGIESPSVAETIPGGIDDGVVGQFRTRVDSLLEPIPAAGDSQRGGPGVHRRGRRTRLHAET